MIDDFARTTGQARTTERANERERESERERARERETESLGVKFVGEIQTV